MSDSRSLKILTASDVDAVLDRLDVEAAISSQAHVFRTYSATHSSSAAAQDGPADLQLPQRHCLVSPQQSMLFMPARISPQTSIKIVSVSNIGGADGLPASTLVMDEVSGKVRAVINARKLTALRNAAGSVLSYRAVVPTRTAKNLVLFGSGAQAESHGRLFIQSHPTIKTCTVVARRSTPRSQELVKKLSATFPDVQVVEGVASYPQGNNGEGGFDLSKAVAAADIIVTMTSSTEALFASKDVAPGTHIIMVGSFRPHMREVEDALVQRAGVVLVDSREACGHEAGELQNTPEENLVELGEVVAGGQKGEEARKRVAESGDVIMFKSVGLGVQDVAITGVILDQADKLGKGVVIPDYD